MGRNRRRNLGKSHRYGEEQEGGKGRIVDVIDYDRDDDSKIYCYDIINWEEISIKCKVWRFGFKTFPFLDGIEKIYYRKKYQI